MTKVGQTLMSTTSHMMTKIDQITMSTARRVLIYVGQMIVLTARPLMTNSRQVIASTTIRLLKKSGEAFIDEQRESTRMDQCKNPERLKCSLEKRKVIDEFDFMRGPIPASESLLFQSNDRGRKSSQVVEKTDSTKSKKRNTRVT